MEHQINWRARALAVTSFAAALVVTSSSALSQSYAGSVMPTRPARGYAVPQPPKFYLVPAPAKTNPGGGRVLVTPGGPASIAMTPYPVQQYGEVKLPPRPSDPTKSLPYRLLDPIDRAVGKTGPVVGKKMTNCGVEAATLASGTNNAKLKGAAVIFGCVGGLIK